MIGQYVCLQCNIRHTLDCVPLSLINCAYSFCSLKDSFGFNLMVSLKPTGTVEFNTAAWSCMQSNRTVKTAGQDAVKYDMHTIGNTVDSANEQRAQWKSCEN